MLTCGPIPFRYSKYGTAEQKQRYLPRLCDESFIGANGASEPTAGSDIFSMQTRVTKDGSDYVLNGRKVFVTNAPIADLFVVYGTLDPKLGVTGICGFIIEKGTPGLSVGKKKDKMACAPHSWPRSYSRETLFFGNGGSAADAQRLAAEFVDDSFPNVQDCRRLR